MRSTAWLLVVLVLFCVYSPHEAFRTTALASQTRVPHYPSARRALTSAARTDTHAHTLRRPPSNNNNNNKFAEVVFPAPIARSLHRLGIVRSPSPIQQAAIPLLAEGRSCLLHAPTGTGKTLAYLLPALRRVYSDERASSSVSGSGRACRVLVLVPTATLEAQVERDVFSLTQDARLVHALSRERQHREEKTQNTLHVRATESEGESERERKGDETAPIWIATPSDLLHRLSSSSRSPSRSPPLSSHTLAHTLRNIEYLVLDEVDRMFFDPVHSPGVMSCDDRENALYALLSSLLRDTQRERVWFQVVGVSATVGRPLRRELARWASGKLLPPTQTHTPTERDKYAHTDTGSVQFEYGGLFSVVRPKESERLTLDNVEHRRERGTESANDGERENENSDAASSRPRYRFVSIPETISHHVMVFASPPSSASSLSDRNNDNRNNGFERNVQSLPQRLALLHKHCLLPLQREVQRRPQTVTEKEREKVLLFVEREDEVQSAVHILRRWGLRETRAVSQREQQALSEQHAGGIEKEMATSNEIESAREIKNDTVRTEERDTETEKHTEKEKKKEAETERGLQIVVAPLSATRGLHVRGVSIVFSISAPRSMDEYVHVAGRTARMQINDDSSIDREKNKAKMSAKKDTERLGAVYTLTDWKGWRKMRAWRTPLGIDMELISLAQ